MQRWIRGAALPALAVTGALVAAGRTLVARGCAEPREDELIHRMREASTREIDEVSRVLSTATGIGITVANGALTCAVTYGRTRDLRKAAAPAVALATETAIFLASSALVGRDRPRVHRPDFTHATGSFPSGHTAANTALAHTIANLLPQGGWWELLKLELRVDVPAIVGLSRVHRGQHHPSDVVAGWALGAWTAWTVKRLLLDA